MIHESLIATGARMSSEQIMAALASCFEDLAEADYPKGLLHQQVLNGTIQFRIVGGFTVPQYAVWYYIQADQMLHANAMLSLSKANRLHEMFNTLDALAKELNCKGVIFETRWRGMIRQFQRQGYRQSAVVMRKDFYERPLRN
jgi:hypothetical protein